MPLVSEDLIKLVSPGVSLPQPLQVFLPLDCPGGRGLQSILLPHELFHCLWKDHHDHWKQCFLPGGVEDLKSFWSRYDAHPAMQGSVLKEKKRYKERLIPLGLHGDSVPTVGCGKVWAKLLQSYSWHGLLGKAPAKLSTFFVWGAFWLIIFPVYFGFVNVFVRITYTFAP